MFCHMFLFNLATFPIGFLGGWLTFALGFVASWILAGLKNCIALLTNFTNKKVKTVVAVSQTTQPSTQ